MPPVREYKIKIKININIKIKSKINIKIRTVPRGSSIANTGDTFKGLLKASKDPLSTPPHSIY